MPMRIFDDFARDDPGRMYDGESMFLFLNRSSRPAVEATRLTIEDWFAAYPPDHQGSLRGSIRSKINNQHHAAYFELFLHELFRKMGFRITIHPDIPNSNHHPDFYLTSDNLSPFYVEAKLASGQSESEIAEEKLWGDVIRCIDEIESPDFYLTIHPKSIPDSPPRLTDIKKHVTKFIHNLSSTHQKGREDICIRGLQFGIGVIPRGDSKGNSRLGSIGSIWGEWNIIPSDLTDHLGDAIERKSKRYGKLDAPYLIAVDIMNASLSPLDLFNVLYGIGPEEIIRPKDGSRLGIELRQSGGVLPKYPNVTAIIAFHQVMPSFIPHDWPIPQAYVCPNPWAQHPLPEAIPRLFRFELVNDRFVPVAGDPLTEILGLPPNWPDD